MPWLVLLCEPDGRLPDPPRWWTGSTDKGEPLGTTEANLAVKFQAAHEALETIHERVPAVTWRMRMSVRRAG